MARLVITPTTQAMNTYTDFTFTAVGTTAGSSGGYAGDGWYCAIEDLDRAVLIAASSHTSAVPIVIYPASSNSDWVYPGSSGSTGAAGAVAGEVGTSAVGLFLLESVKFATTSGIFITAPSSGSTALRFACAVIK